MMLLSKHLEFICKTRDMYWKIIDQSRSASNNPLFLSINSRCTIPPTFADSNTESLFRKYMSPNYTIKPHKCSGESLRDVWVFSRQNR